MNWSTMADLGRAGKLDRLLSLKTMQVRQINVRSFINWCELEYQGIFTTGIAYLGGMIQPLVSALKHS